MPSGGGQLFGEKPGQAFREKLQIRPYDARHTFVTHLLEAGANPVYVKQQAGHHSAAFTLDVYGRLIPSQKSAHNLPTNEGTIRPQQDLRP